MAACTEAAGDGENTALVEAEKAVEDLYGFRDHYFDTYGVEKAAEKTKDVEKQLKKTLELLDKLQDAVENKSQYLMLRGKALNVMPSYDAKAQEFLAKAVKLDPKLAEAWTQLGECYWKNGDIQSAKNCFTGALSHSKDKKSLRNLSMVLRQLGTDPDERFKYIEEGVEKAKEALHMDLKDGTSWFILGNAYLSLFFASNQSPKILKQCLSAYQQAEKETVAATNPDLHFNRSTVYKYQEDYELALAGFARASLLDPMWPEPTEKEKCLLDYLTKLSDLIQTKGKIKGKRLHTMVQSIKETDLGPYSGGSYTSPHGKSITLTRVPIEALQPERNPEKLVVGKVVGSLTSDDPVPFTFCMVDKDESCIAVTVYNIAPGYGFAVGDTIAIPEPYVQIINFKHKESEFDFRSIRVDSPVVLVVNGRKLGVDKQAPTVLAVSAKSE